MYMYIYMSTGHTTHHPSRTTYVCCVHASIDGPPNSKQTTTPPTQNNQGRSRALSISNLGVTDGLFTPTPAGVSVGRTQWGIDEGFVGHSIFLAVASYRGCLNVTLSYSPSIFTREMAAAFAEGIRGRLAAAAGGGGDAWTA